MKEHAPRTDAGRGSTSHEPGTHRREPYLKHGDTDEEYSPGYRIGYEAAGRHTGQNPVLAVLTPETRTQYERLPLGRKYGTAL